MTAVGGMRIARLRRSLLAAALVAAAAPAADAAAQVRLSVAGGPSFPVGELRDEFDAGWHAQVSAGFGLQMIPIELRVDGALNQLPEEHGHFRTFSGTLNGLVKLPVPLLAPYLIGGVGVYNSRVEHDEEEGEDEHDHGEGSTTNIGANVGVGLRLGLGGLALFAEARLHNLFTEGAQTRFAPLSIGVRF